MNVFTTVIYEPILNTLLFFQRMIPGHDIGVAIILVTLATKVLLYYPSLSAIRASRQLQTLQPKLNALKAQYKNDKEGFAREQMKLYKVSKVNPFSSCLTTIIQFPILIGLYQVFFNGLKLTASGHLAATQLKHVYPFLRHFFETTPINTMFLHVADMSKPHNIILAVLATAATYWQLHMLAAPTEPKIPGAKDESLASAMNKQNKYILPLITLFFSWRFSAGLALYWFVSTLFTVGQQYLFMRQHPVRPSEPPHEQRP